MTPGTAWVPDFCAYVGAAAPPETSDRLPWAAGATNTLAKDRGWRPRHPTWRGNWGS